MFIGFAVGLLVQPIIVNLVSRPSVLLRVAVLIALVILAPLALFIASLVSRILPVLYQFAQFAAVGVLNTSIDLGVLNLEIFLSGRASGIYFSAFKAVSFVASTFNSYLWNKHWTFGSGETKASKEIVKFYAFAAVGLALNVSVASYIVNSTNRPLTISANLWANIGAIAGIFSALVWDFLSYKYFVFKKSSPDADKTVV